jgi:hypothetical protein
MECASCEAILDELRRGNLPARLEAEARSHLALCPGCRGAHMRLLRADAETALPSPATTRSSRFRAGLGLVRWLRPRPKARTSELPARPSTSHGTAALGLLARLAMAPQVAMGTVMLLIVLVGLWSLPQLTRRDASRFRASVQSERVNRPRPETDTAAISASPINAPGEAPMERVVDPRSHALRKAQPSAAAKSIQKSDLDTAMQHYRAREYALATPLFSRALVGATSSSDETKALLYLARAERALGHCDRAVNSYDTLVRIHPGKMEARAALREAVACYTRLGEPGRAQRLLDHAAETPQLATSARNIIAEYPAFAKRKAASAAQASAAVRSD